MRRITSAGACSCKPSSCKRTSKEIFVGLTDEELEKADGFDVVNTFNQLVSAVGKINGGNSKNA